MNQASNLAYLKRKPASSKPQTFAASAQRRAQVKGPQSQQAVLFESPEDVEVDTNVVAIGFDILKGAKNNLHQGDPITCSKCESVLNKFSKILSSNEYLYIIQPEKKEVTQEKNGNCLYLIRFKAIQIEESKNQSDLNKQQECVLLLKQKGEILNLKESESVWVCEFCTHINKVMVEKEEIPKEEDVVYMLQSFQQVQKEKQNVQADLTVVLCIDNSGSMSTTTEVKGKVNLKHGLPAEEYEMLKQFIEPGDEHQQYPGLHNKNVTYISRKQCVLAAIENQIQEMTQANPNRIVGLVTFNNEVVLIGDGSQQPVVIAGDRLSKAEDIRTISTQAGNVLLSKTVKESSVALLEKFSKLQEKGQTALGPALLSSLQLASQGKQGSMVILCTDGLANLGLGAFDGSDQASEQVKGFYSEVALSAKNAGISISVVTIKGEGCKMDVLGQLAEQTNGNVTRVNPNDIGKDFANILKDEVVGTQVILIVKMHKAFKFRNEELNVVEDKQILRREIGNATMNTQITFEYELRNDEELQQQGVNLGDLKQVPFQARIEYTNLNGDKLLRVLTQMVSTTEDIKKAEKEARVDVIHTRIQQETAKYIRRGTFQNAQNYNNRWDTYVQSDNLNKNLQNKQQNLQFKGVNKKLNKVAAKQEVRVSKRFANTNKESAGTVGFFGKLPSSKAPQQLNQKQKKASIARKSSMDSFSDSDEDMEEAEVMQFQQAKRK